jgi:hypothetical protein
VEVFIFFLLTEFFFFFFFFVKQILPIQKKNEDIMMTHVQACKIESHDIEYLNTFFYKTFDQLHLKY